MTHWVAKGAEPSVKIAARTAALEAAQRRNIARCKTEGHDAVDVTQRWLDGPLLRTVVCSRCQATGYLGTEEDV